MRITNQWLRKLSFDQGYFTKYWTHHQDIRLELRPHFETGFFVYINRAWGEANPLVIVNTREEFVALLRAIKSKVMNYDP